MKIRQISLQTSAINVEQSPYTEKVSEYFINLKKLMVDKFSVLYDTLHSFIKRREKTYDNGSGFTTQNKKGFKIPSLKNKKLLGSMLVVIAVALLFFVGSRLKKNAPEENQTGNRVEVKGAISSVDVGKEFDFPLKDSSGEEVSKVRYIIEKAELTDEIITEGKRATAVKGRVFLILILKIVNTYEKPIEINTRDYVRLSVNGNEEELLAPDTHNDPVEIQAISTKYTRVGFIINELDENLVLHIGEIQGDKEKVNISLQ